MRQGQRAAQDQEHMAMRKPEIVHERTKTGDSLGLWRVPNVNGYVADGESSPRGASQYLNFEIVAPAGASQFEKMGHGIGAKTALRVMDVHACFQPDPKV